jgi:hypothetical protein
MPTTADHTLRLLHRRSQFGYTSSQGRALRGDLVAVSGEAQEKLTLRGVAVWLHVDEPDGELKSGGDCQRTPETGLRQQRTGQRPETTPAPRRPAHRDCAGPARKPQLSR